MTNNYKRIILIGPMPPYRGGIARFSASLAEQLLELGHDVNVISFRKQYPKLLYPGKTEKDYSQSMSIADTKFVFSPLNPKDWSMTLKQIKCFQPDLVIDQWWTTFWAPATSWLIHKLNKARINTKILIHNAFPHESTKLDKKLTSWALRGGRSFVTMTELQAEYLRDAVGPQAEIVTVPHPIYKQFPVSGLSKVEVRKKIGLPLEVPVALFFGFVRPYKGLRVLLDAMAILKSENINIHLVIAGEFWDDQAVYEKQIVKLGIEDMVTIQANYIPDSEAGLYFEAADLFVAPYIDGTQSGSIKVAMNYQLPMVVTDTVVDGLLESLHYQYVVVPHGTAPSLAKGIRKALKLSLSTITNDQLGRESWARFICQLLSCSSQENKG